MADTQAGIMEELKDAFKEGTVFTPRVSKELAINLVKERYGLQVTEIRELVSFVDQNFHVQVSQQHENPHIDEIWEHGYTVKFINTTKSSIEGHFTSIHMTIIRLHEKGLRVPLPVTNLEGSTFQLVNVPLLNEGDVNPEERKKCGMHILTYIPGTTVASIDNTAETFFQCGVMLARFHNSLQGMVNPVLKNKVAFSSLKFVENIRVFIGEKKDERKSMVYDVLDRYPLELKNKLDDLPQGFIHGDFNDHNILTQTQETKLGEKVNVVDGILDFEDMQWGQYVWDLCILLTHATLIRKTVEPLEGAAYAMAGYRTIRTLNNLELSVVKICMECRISMTLCISSFQDKFDPSNTYIASLADPEPKFRVLEQLRNMTNDELLQMFDDLAKQCVNFRK